MKDTLRQRSSSAGRLLLVALTVFGIGGCARLDRRSSVVVAQPAPPSAAPVAAAGERSLASIVNNELQRGHYAEGESALRQYMRQHPGDRAAQAILRQLTADPRQMLGDRSRQHVVQAGDSYSTLAARYLGDPNLFLILARYNGSTDPSLLRAGETLRMPLSAKERSSAAPAPVADDTDSTAGASATSRSVTAPADESLAAKARRLQNESATLLDQGHKDQALARLDEALAIDPRLKPANGTAALRTDLLGSYHERAIVLYRDQQLEQAIALWNRVLAIDPDYEPAIVYRARALELQHRLKQY